jgi:hypothetical protein
VREFKEEEWPKLLAPVRDILHRSGVHYVMENVEKARRDMVDPFTLCGCAFKDTLKVWRKRLFETNIDGLGAAAGVPCDRAWHRDHAVRDPQNVKHGIIGDFFEVTGNGGGQPWGTIDEHFDAMGYASPATSAKSGTLGRFQRGPMTYKGLTESVPPAYAERIGVALLSRPAANQGAL